MNQINIHTYFRKPNLKYYVYGIKDGRGVVRYVGCTCYNIKYRLSSHISSSRNSKFASAKYREYFKYFKKVGLNKVKAEVFLYSEFDNPFDAAQLEYELIEFLPYITNCRTVMPYANMYSIKWFMWMRARGGYDLIEKFRVRYFKKLKLWSERYEAYQNRKLQIA